MRNDKLKEQLKNIENSARALRETLINEELLIIRDTLGAESFKDIENLISKSDGVFDVIPAIGYAGSPVQWREMLKPVIDFAACELLTNYDITECDLYIIGNPIDLMLLSNINWATPELGQYFGAYSYIVKHVEHLVGTLYIAIIKDNIIKDTSTIKISNNNGYGFGK